MEAMIGGLFRLILQGVDPMTGANGKSFQSTETNRYAYG
jgi:hypothetical protein